MVDWSYFDKFEKVNEEYLPDNGRCNQRFNALKW